MPLPLSISITDPRAPESTDELPAKWRQRGRFRDEHGDALRHRTLVGVDGDGTGASTASTATHASLGSEALAAVPSPSLPATWCERDCFCDEPGDALRHRILLGVDGDGAGASMALAGARALGSEEWAALPK